MNENCTLEPLFNNVDQGKKSNPPLHLALEHKKFRTLVNFLDKCGAEPRYNSDLLSLLQQKNQNNYNLLESALLLEGSEEVLKKIVAMNLLSRETLQQAMTLITDKSKYFTILDEAITNSKSKNNFKI